MNAHIKTHAKEWHKCPACSAIISNRRYVIERHEKGSCRNRNRNRKNSQLALNDSHDYDLDRVSVGLQSTTLYFEKICERLTEVYESGKPDTNYTTKQATKHPKNVTAQKRPKKK